ncbi:hypothetical protein Tco_0785090 [Tanacetum coccineum]
MILFSSFDLHSLAKCPRPTSTRSTLTLKPLPKIDPKDKGKKKIEEENETESEDDDIPQAVKKFKQLESDEELARKVQEKWEAEEEKNKIAEEEATNEALINNIDDVKARIEADRILAEKLQEQEREQFTIEERAKFLHDTIAAQRNSAQDEKVYQEMNEKRWFIKEEDEGQKKEDTFNALHVDDSDKENDDLRLYLTIAQDEDKEVDYEILDRKYHFIAEDSCLGTNHSLYESKEGEINLNVGNQKSNGQKSFERVLWEIEGFVQNQMKNESVAEIAEKTRMLAIQGWSVQIKNS